MDAARERSLLYRGASPLLLGHRTSQDGSTYFAYSANYESGTVIFRGKSYSGVELNLNALTDELYVKNPFLGLPVLLNKSFVDSFDLGTHSFVRYEQDKHSILNEGYYEVLFSDRLVLIKKIRKQFREDPIGGSRIIGSYSLTESFYLQKNATWYLLRKKSDLKKLFPDQKKLIQSVAKTKNLDFSNRKAEFILAIITLINSI